jgi:hypothetical protein
MPSSGADSTPIYHYFTYLTIALAQKAQPLWPCAGQQVFSLPLPEPTAGTTRQKWYRQCFAATAFAFFTPNYVFYR